MRDGSWRREDGLRALQRPGEARVLMMQRDVEGVGG